MSGVESKCSWFYSRELKDNTEEEVEWRERLGEDTDSDYDDDSEDDGYASDVVDMDGNRI